MWSYGILRPILRTERSVQVKLAGKIHAKKRQKRNLDGLYEILAPGSIVGKVSPIASVIKEPKKPKVRTENQILRNSEPTTSDPLNPLFLPNVDRPPQKSTRIHSNQKKYEAQE